MWQTQGVPYRKQNQVHAVFCVSCRFCFDSADEVIQWSPAYSLRPIMFLRWRKGLKGIFKFSVIFSIFPHTLDLLQGRKHDAFLKSYRSLFQSQTIWYINVECAKDVHETHNNQLFLDMRSPYMKKSTETDGWLEGYGSKMALEGVWCLGLESWRPHLGNYSTYVPCHFLYEDRICNIFWFF